jgi:ADP-heptose:LPS heptosyltransferase
MAYLWLTWLFAPLLRHLAGRAPAGPQRIIVIQMAKIGDMVCTTPVFRALKARYPQAHLSVMAIAQNAPLLRVNPHVDAVIEADARQFRGLHGKWRLARLLRAAHADTLICLNAGAAYAVAALWALIPRRLAVQSNVGGSSHRLAARLWSETELHRGDRLIQATYMALLARLGVREASMDKEIFMAPGAAAKAEAVLGLYADAMPVAPGVLVGIGVSSGNRLKALGSEKIIAVAQQILAAQPAVRFVLIGSKDEQSQAQDIARHLPPAAVIDACGALGIAELPALLQRLTVFIGVDSGVTYMADALNLPIVSVAGPVDMQETRPVGQRVIILQRTNLPCVPCSHTFDAPYTCRVGTRACIKEISAVEIARAALALLTNSLEKSSS